MLYAHYLTFGSAMVTYQPVEISVASLFFYFPLPVIKIVKTILLFLEYITDNKYNKTKTSEYNLREHSVSKYHLYWKPAYFTSKENIHVKHCTLKVTSVCIMYN